MGFGCRVVEEVETEEMLEQRLIRQFTIVKPKSFCKLPPGSTTEFSIKFAPARRMKTFVQKVCRRNGINCCN